jgi:S-DNA-T family DNA segregation ATPase FtsK/SpoIIIE
VTETRTHLDPGPLLRVRVRFGAGSPPGSGATRIDRGRDVVITAPHGATVADVIDAADLPVSGVDWSVINLRSGEIAAPAEPFAVLAPLDGDHLLITDADGAAAYRERGPSTVARHAIEVLSGPASGERYLVRERTCTIGRDDDRADVAITDPSLSREHLRIASDTGGWTIEDLGSRNGSAVDGVALTPGRPTALADGAVIEAGRSTLRFRAGGDAPAERSAPRADGTIGFNTPPRVAPEPFARSHDAPEVPKRAVGPRLPLIASVIPVIAGVVLWRLTDQTLMLAFCLLAPVMAIGTYLSDRMNGRSDFKKLRREFLEAVDELEPEIEAQRAAEHALRLDLYPDAREVVRRMVDGDRRLWERRATHHDDLHLRVGLADQPSEVTLQLPKGGDPELRTHLTEHVPLQPDLPGTPATIDLRERSPVGLAGPDALREGLLRWLVLQVAALHSPRDVQIVALLGEPLRRWDWLKWLPHVPRSGIGTGGAPSIGTTDAAVAEQLAALSDLIRDRAPDGLGAPALNGAPRVVVVVRDEAVRDRSLLGPLLTDTAVQAGVHVLWESSRRDALPSGARTLIELDESRAVGSLVDTVDRSTIREIQIESTPLSVAEEAAAALAPVRDTTHSDRGLASLPAIASLLDLADARPISAATDGRALGTRSGSRSEPARTDRS